MSESGTTVAELSTGSARPARRFIQETLAGWGLEHLTRQAVMVGHELVANALRHGQPPALLRLERRDDCVLVEVSDASDALPQLAEIDNSTSPSGRGMRIVASLTRGWGVRRHGGTETDPGDQRSGKTVWAEIAR